MLSELRQRPDSPLRRKLEKLVLRRLSDRIALEAYRGMSREEIGLRLMLVPEEVAEVVAFGVGRGTLEETGGMVRKNREEPADASVH